MANFKLILKYTHFLSESLHCSAWLLSRKTLNKNNYTVISSLHGIRIYDMFCNYFSLCEILSISLQELLITVQPLILLHLPPELKKQMSSCQLRSGFHTMSSWRRCELTNCVETRADRRTRFLKICWTLTNQPALCFKLCCTRRSHSKWRAHNKCFGEIYWKVIHQVLNVYYFYLFTLNVIDTT